MLCGDNFCFAFPSAVLVPIDACKNAPQAWYRGIAEYTVACPLAVLGCVKWAGGGMFPLWAGGPTAPGEVDTVLCFWRRWAELLGHG